MQNLSSLMIYVIIYTIYMSLLQHCKRALILLEVTTDRCVCDCVRMFLFYYNENCLTYTVHRVFASIAT